MHKAAAYRITAIGPPARSTSPTALVFRNRCRSFRRTVSYGLDIRPRPLVPMFQRTFSTTPPLPPPSSTTDFPQTVITSQPLLNPPKVSSPPTDTISPVSKASKTDVDSNSTHFQDDVEFLELELKELMVGGDIIEKGEGSAFDSNDSNRWTEGKMSGREVNRAIGIAAKMLENPLAVATNERGEKIVEGIALNVGEDKTGEEGSSKASEESVDILDSVDAIDSDEPGLQRTNSFHAGKDNSIRNRRSLVYSKLDPYLPPLSQMVSWAAERREAHKADGIQSSLARESWIDVETVARHCFVRSFVWIQLTPSGSQPQVGDFDLNHRQSKRLRHWSKGNASGLANSEPHVEAERALLREGYENFLKISISEYKTISEAEGKSRLLKAIIHSLSRTLSGIKGSQNERGKSRESGSKQLSNGLAEEPIKNLLGMWSQASYLLTTMEENTSVNSVSMPFVANHTNLFSNLATSMSSPQMPRFFWDGCENNIAIQPGDAGFLDFLQHVELRALTLDRHTLRTSFHNRLVDGDMAGFAILWDHVMSSLINGKVKARQDREGGPHNNANQSDAKDFSLVARCTSPEYRSIIICAILESLWLGARTPLINSRKLPVDAMVKHLLDTHVRPYSSAVWRCVLMLREDLILDRDRLEELSMAGKADFAYAKINADWATGMKDVKKEIPLYAEYMKIAGRHDDLQKLGKIWEELRTDEVCRKMTLEQARVKGNVLQYPPNSIFNHLISILLNIKNNMAAARAFAFSVVRYLLDPANDYKPDLHTFNTILRHHAMQRDIPSFNEVWAKISEIGLKPDVISYTTKIHALILSWKGEEVDAVLDEMERNGIKKNEYLWSKLIADSARTGSKDGLRQAERAMSAMVKDGFTPNVVTWTGLIGGYFRGGFGKQAMKAMDNMISKKVDLNVKAFNMIIRSVMDPSPSSDSNNTAGQRKVSSNTSHSDDKTSLFQPKAAFTILRLMESHHVQPDNDTYFLLLTGFIRNGMMEEASAIVDEMDRVGFRCKQDGEMGRGLRKIAGWKQSRGRR